MTIIAVDFRSIIKEYDTGVVRTTVIFIIDFGAPQKTSNTVEMYPPAGDIANVSHNKINLISVTISAGLSYRILPKGRGGGGVGYSLIWPM